MTNPLASTAKAKLIERYGNLFTPALLIAGGPHSGAWLLGQLGKPPGQVDVNVALFMELNFGLNLNVHHKEQVAQ